MTIAAAMSGLSCAIIGFLLPLTTAVAFANAAPKTEIEAETFHRATLVWAATLVLTFFALAWLCGVAFYRIYAA